MIPVHLTIQGFLSYKDPVEIDFEQIHLASITGPNGAGKSSILDALTWSLFGNARAKKDQVINQQSDSALVILDFEYEQQLFRVRRTKQLGKTELLEFYIRDQEGNHWRPLTEHSVGDTQNRIQSTLRLDYKTFINASFFLQGKADQFTQLSSGDRKAILANILGLEVWENYLKTTKEIRKDSESTKKQLDRILADINNELSNEEQIKFNLAQAQKDLEVKNKTKQDHNQIIDQAKQLDSARSSAASQIEQQKKDIQKISDILEKNKSRQSNLLIQLDDLQKQVQNAKQIEENYQQWIKVRSELDELTKKATAYQKINQALITTNHQIEKEYESLKMREISLGEKNSKIEQFRKELPEIENELQEFVKKLEMFAISISKQKSLSDKMQKLQGEISARKQNIRHLENLNNEKRNHLKEFRVAGPECPFCSQPLTPEHREQYESLIIKEGLERKEMIDLENKFIEEFKNEINEISVELKNIEALEKESTDLQNLMTEKRLNKESMQKSVEEWQEKYFSDYQNTMQQLENHYFEQKYKSQVISLKEEIKKIDYDDARHASFQQLENNLRGTEEKYRMLVSARATLDPITKQSAELSDDIRHNNEELAEKSALLESMQIEFNRLYANLPDITRLKKELDEIDIEISQISRKLGAEKQKLDTIERRKIDKQTTQSELDQLVVKINRYQKLEEAFGTNGVPALLIEQALPEIEAHANELLDRLTLGQLSILFETQSEYKDKKRQDKKETLDILINDANGHTRAYEMFSGGEAFRINFAIRLALSQVLAKRSGARLQTLVIDEGFGSQDTTGRSRLVETINVVKKDFSKILIITHLEELKDAFPGRIEVEKTPSGSRAEVIVYS
ncbi:MAG: SMC family ATPase [Anaerolineaceae bacterium]|jgi:exonuclease SbcC|nr:SMC family ATPase [Anaerolineaceae bacterium]